MHRVWVDPCNYTNDITNEPYNGVFCSINWLKCITYNISSSRGGFRKLFEGGLDIRGCPRKKFLDLFIHILNIFIHNLYIYL